MVTAMWSVSNRTGTSNSKSAVTLDAQRRRYAEGDEPGRRVDRPARELLYAVQVHLHRAGDRLGDGADLDHAPGRIVLDQLELGLRVIACPQQLARGLVVGPVLEPETVGLAPARPKERDQLVDLGLLLEPARDIPPAARLGPVDVALLVPRSGRHDRGGELRPARRPIGDVVRQPDLVEAAHTPRLSPPNRPCRLQAIRHLG
jgi:hypothetical protein